MSTEKSIVVYGRSTPVCVFCKRAQDLLDYRNIEYTYKDLSKDEWAPADLSETLGVRISTVPVVVIDGKYLGGFAELYDYVNAL